MYPTQGKGKKYTMSKTMKDITPFMKEKNLIDKIEEYLRDLCMYDYQFHAEKIGTKPELIFQQELQDTLQKDYKVERSYPINVDKLAVLPTTNEENWEIDLKVSDGDVNCYIEMKYDEVKEDGTSTNPLSEEEIIRDAYKLQCIKRTKPQSLCLIVFATNNQDHDNFTKIEADDYKISYNGEDEQFKILHSYHIAWYKTSMFDEEGYRYFILEISE